jgi:plastocyanin
MKSFQLIAIFASAILCLDAGAAVVSGTVSFATRRGQKPNPSETVVSLEPLSGKVPKKSAAAMQMTTRGKTLLPHVLVVPAGSTVVFPNEDPISHNLFSLSPGNQFDLGLYRKGSGKTQAFNTPGVVNVYCNVHPNMSAVIHVMATPYFTFADANGGWSFDVPAGRYKLAAWHELGGSTETIVEVAANGQVTGTTRLTIDSRSHRTTPHLNKEGRPYRAPAAKDY